MEVAKNLTDVYGREVDIEQEKKIWREFVGRYKEYDEKQLTEIVKQSINLATSFVMSDKKLGPEKFKKFKGGYIKYLQNNGMGKKDVFASKHVNDFEELIQQSILKDEQIKSLLEKVFGLDGDVMQNFVADVVVLMRSPKMKTFVFRYLKEG